MLGGANFEAKSTYNATVNANDVTASNHSAPDASQSFQLAITDVFLVITAANERQVGAVVDGFEEALRGVGAKPVRREGDREQRWVLLDYLDVVVHVQHAEERRFYALERLWSDCPLIPLTLT